MRERIEQVGDILLAAAHADHHVEAAEIDKIEAILKSIWRQEPSPDSLVRRVTEFREGEAVDAGEMARLGSMLRDLQPRGEELPSSLVQRLADFDASRFDIDEAVGPFLHESVEFKRELLELAVAVHESDGELDFAEDTFVRELGFKLGLELRQFQDLLLEFLPADSSASARKPDWAALDDTDAAEQAEARDLVSSIQTELLVPTPGVEPGTLLAPTRATGRPRSNGAGKRKPAAAETQAAKRESKLPAVKAKTPGKMRATKEPGSKSAKKPKSKAPAAKKKAASKKKAAKKRPVPAKKAKKPVASKKAAKKKPGKKRPTAKKAKKSGKKR